MKYKNRKIKIELSKKMRFLYKINTMLKKIIKLIPDSLINTDRIINCIDYRNYTFWKQWWLIIIAYISIITSFLKLMDYIGYDLLKNAINKIVTDINLLTDNSIANYAEKIFKFISESSIQDWLKIIFTVSSIKNLLWLISTLIVFGYLIQKARGIKNGYKVLKVNKKPMRLINNTEYNVIKPPDGKFESKNYEIVNKIQEICFYSKELNEKLQTKTSNSKIIFDEDKKKKVKKFIKKHFKKLKVFLDYKYIECQRYNKIFQNDYKLCLSKDIDVNLNKVYCHVLGYYDTYLTNLTVGHSLHDSVDNETVSELKYFPILKINNSVKLREISSDNLNNEIGVSTIGITSDNFVVFWIQNEKALSSVNFIVPTGSGSCDYSDIQKENGDMDFIKTIIYAMERELIEESTGEKSMKKRNDYIEKTQLLGYFRWLTKAGKPEFVGVTKLKIPCNSLMCNYKEVREDYEKTAIKINSSKEFQNILNEQLKINYLSVPLRYNIEVLLKYIDDDPDRIIPFLELGE